LETPAVAREIERGGVQVAGSSAGSRDEGAEDGVCGK